MLNKLNYIGIEDNS